MPTKHYQKPKKGFEKRLVKSIKIFLKKKKRKKEKVKTGPKKGIKILLKKKKKKSINIYHERNKNLSEDQKQSKSSIEEVII